MFTYLESSVSSTENDINTLLVKAWTAIDRLLVIWKSKVSDKLKHSFFYKQRSYTILLYGCTTWTLTKRLEKKLDDNYTRMLRAVLNKSRRQHPTKQQLYGHLPPITKTIQIRRIRRAGELISDLLLWIPAYGRAKVGRPAGTYLQQFCADFGCSLEDLLGAVDDRKEWRKMVREIHASRTICDDDDDIENNERNIYTYI